MLSSNNTEMTVEEHEQLQAQQVSEHMAIGELLLESPAAESSVEAAGMMLDQVSLVSAAAAMTSAMKETPQASRRESYGGSGSVTAPSTGKRRGRPRGWTDARIHQILTYLERNMHAFKTVSPSEFYTSLCVNIGFDISESAEIQEKCDKMIKKYDNDTRRGDASWKWYARMNQVFGGPPLAGFAGLARGLADDDAASSSLDSDEAEEETVEGDAEGEIRKRVRGEDPFHDRFEHEKLLLKLKKLKSKTEMRHRDWENAMEKQAAAFEELKTKTASAIARLEKSIVNAGYELDQNELLAQQQ